MAEGESAGLTYVVGGQGRNRPGHTGPVGHGEIMVFTWGRWEPRGVLSREMTYLAQI